MQSGDSLALRQTPYVQLLQNHIIQPFAFKFASGAYTKGKKTHMHPFDTFDSRHIFAHALQIDVCNVSTLESVLLHKCQPQQKIAYEPFGAASASMRPDLSVSGSAVPIIMKPTKSEAKGSM